MKICVTGGAGFIASHVADRYLSLGHDVVIIDNLSTGNLRNLPKSAQFYNISITSPEIKEILQKEKPEVINHHAAQIDVRKSVADPVFDATTNILGSLQLFEAAKEVGVKKIIFASTGGAIYGEQDFFPADLTHRTDPESPYGITKLAVEKYLQFYSWTHGISHVCLRYANVYGPRQNSHGEAGVVAIFTEKLLKGEVPTIIGDGKQTRDYVYVGDVADCNVAALDSKITGLFQVGTGIETSVNALSALLVKRTGKSILPIHAPKKPGEQQRSCLKPGALQKKKPVTLDEGLQKTVEWFKCSS